jgi:hypothetical protein
MPFAKREDHNRYHKEYNQRRAGCIETRVRQDAGVGYGLEYIQLGVKES